MNQTEAVVNAQEWLKRFDPQPATAEEISRHNIPASQIWTMVSDDDGVWRTYAGFWRINAIEYYVSDQPLASVFPQAYDYTDGKRVLKYASIRISDNEQTEFK